MDLLRFARNDGLAVIAREDGRSGIPETSVIESRRRGVLNPPEAAFYRPDGVDQAAINAGFDFRR